MQSSKDVSTVCKALGVAISFAAICFFISNLSLFLLISSELIHQCQGAELDPSAFPFFTVTNVKAIYYVHTDDREGSISDLRLGKAYKSTMDMFL